MVEITEVGEFKMGEMVPKVDSNILFMRLDGGQYHGLSWSTWKNSRFADGNQALAWDC